MANKYRLGASLLALMTVALVEPKAASAADVMDTGCTLQGAVKGGGLLGWQSYDSDSSSNPDETDWSALFAEAAGMVTCDAWNFQADYAYYGHSADIGDKDSIDDLPPPLDQINGGLDGKSLDVDAPTNHFGGALFWRDSQVGAFGLSGSYIMQNADWWIFDKETDYLRGGLFGEYYVNDQFTLGGSVHYFSGSMDAWGKDVLDHDGFEFAAIAKFYAMPELGLTLRGDYMVSDFSYDDDDGGTEGFDGYALTAEAEYLVMDQGLSLFGGARFASRGFEDSEDFSDMQIYAGLKFAFGGNGGISLVDLDRSGTYDNTSVMLEKLPGPMASEMAASASFLTEE